MLPSGGSSDISRYSIPDHSVARVRAASGRSGMRVYRRCFGSICSGGSRVVDGGGSRDSANPQLRFGRSGSDGMFRRTGLPLRQKTGRDFQSASLPVPVDLD